MDRRKVLKLAAAALAVGGAGAVTLTTAFKPEIKPAAKPKKLEYKDRDSEWTYTHLDPDITASLAYENYPKGSCMYGVFTSIIFQLAEKIGEPFSSFPVQMMKYGHGGVCGSGTICGTLNGAAALIGLLHTKKEVRDVLMAELFSYYESTPLPVFKPNEPIFDCIMPTSVANAFMCHASASRWVKTTGLRIDSQERIERCRRLTADIAAKTVSILNDYHENIFMANMHDNETVRTCMTCHSQKGKVANTNGKMNCTSCHTKSVGHEMFGDSHYEFMDER
jgi:hypothetical protein